MKEQLSGFLLLIALIEPVTANSQGWLTIGYAAPYSLEHFAYTDYESLHDCYMERKKLVFLNHEPSGTVTKAYGGMKAQRHEFLTLTLRVSGQLHSLAALTPRGVSHYSLRRCVVMLSPGSW